MTKEEEKIAAYAASCQPREAQRVISACAATSEVIPISRIEILNEEVGHTTTVSAFEQRQEEEEIEEQATEPSHATSDSSLSSALSEIDNASVGNDDGRQSISGDDSTSDDHEEQTENLNSNDTDDLPQEEAGNPHASPVDDEPISARQAETGDDDLNEGGIPVANPVASDEHDENEDDDNIAIGVPECENGQLVFPAEVILASIHGSSPNSTTGDIEAAQPPPVNILQKDVSFIKKWKTCAMLLFIVIVGVGVTVIFTVARKNNVNPTVVPNLEEDSNLTNKETIADSYDKVEDAPDEKGQGGKTKPSVGTPSSKPLTSSPSFSPSALQATASPTISASPTSANYFLTARLLEPILISGGNQHKVKGSPQHRAFEWIETTSWSSSGTLSLDGWDSYELTLTEKQERLTQRYVLAVLYFSTGGDDWDDDNQFLSAKHECDWYSSDGRLLRGITCDDNQRVIKLILGELRKKQHY